MNRTRFFAALMVGAVTVAASAYAAQPQAQGRAEQKCTDHGVQPRSVAWELCLSHVTRALEWGEVTLANQLARTAGDAREDCMERGMRPESPSYRACVSRMMDTHSNLMILGDDQSGVNVAEAR